ncbi:head-tail connector protein [Aquamicrobium segne]|uniref:Head-tail connector protein n=1 Tax=Aquamicrobium segne TaxID=469547 RepID=A0ABW0H1C7_9HYPH
MLSNSVARFATTTGYETKPGPPSTSTVPDPLKVAILLLVGHWYQNREATSSAGMASLPFAVEALIAPYRRMQL